MPTKTIDTRGLKCPLPVLKLEKAAETIRAGSKVLLLADDPIARADIPLACKKLGFSVSISQDDNTYAFKIAAR